LLIQVLKPIPKSVGPTGQIFLNLVMIQNVRTIAYNKNTKTGLVVLVVVGDIPNRYTSDVILNQQARVAHQGWYGGFAIPGGPVAGVATMVLDAGAYGGSLDRPMADY
jgi:hypothetical protein